MPDTRLGAIQNEECLVWSNNAENNEFIVYCRATAKEGVIASLKHGASLAKISAWDARQINQG